MIEGAGINEDPNVDDVIRFMQNGDLWYDDECIQRKFGLGDYQVDGFMALHNPYFLTRNGDLHRGVYWQYCLRHRYKIETTIIQRLFDNDVHSMRQTFVKR